jgi:integrase
MYLTAAAERLAVATLQVHLAAIVTAHRLVGLSLDPGHPGIALLMDGIRRRRGTRPARQATPITPAKLARMVRAQPATPLGLRNRAILLAGFGGALRRSEIVGLDVGDLEFVDGKGVVLTVRRSKTDQHGAGQAVAVWRSNDPDLCAPTALRRWLEHRAACHADDPLFVGLRAGGVMTAIRLSDKAVVRLVRDTAEAVGDGDPGLDGKNLRQPRCRRHPQLLGPQPARWARHRGGRGGAPRRHAPDPPQVGRGRPPLHALRRPLAQQRYREGHAPSNLRTGEAARPPKQS